MPCSDGGETWEQKEQASRFRDVMTRLACDRCKDFIAKQGYVPEWAEEWWAFHKAQDTQRRKESADARRSEAVRQRALSKLTPIEREELGV